MNLLRRACPALLLILVFITASVDASELEAGFNNPPVDARPLGWWHWINGNVTKEGIKADLEAAKRAGMGGVQMFDVEIYMPPGSVRYGSDAWHEHVQYAIETADELGLEFHLMNTPGWSASGGPWVTAELSMKQLVWSETKTAGGKISLAIPKSAIKSPSAPRHSHSPKSSDLDFYRDIALLAVPQTSARIDDLDKKINAAAKPISRPPNSDVKGISLSQVINLTAHLNADGVLTTTLPAGDWVMLRFGYISTGRGNHPAVPEGTGLEIDKLDADAVAFQFEKAVGRIIKEAGPLAGKTFNALLFDSFEAGFQTWTQKFPAEFQARKSYALIPYLPVLTGRIIESPAVSEAVLWDFRHVIEELIADNYFGTMHRLAAKHGIKLYSESQGGPLNPMSSNRHVDVPMNEFWMPDATSRAARIKQSVSSASLAGKRVVAAEAFTATPENGKYQNSPSRLKRPGDQAFALGINRFAFHSFTHQPVTEAAPGFALGRYGTHFGRLNTWWPYADGWIDYVSRSQFLLQQGRIAADVCFLIDEDLGYGIPEAMMTMLPGYNFELCYPPTVREMTVRDGALHHPSGAEFQLLVTPGDWLGKTWVTELSTLKHIRQLVHSGATLSGEPPVAPAGLKDLQQQDEFDQLVDELWGGLDGRVQVKKRGAGHVHTTKLSPVEILQQKNIVPDLSWTPPDVDFKFIHRTTEDADIYFVFNNSAQTVATELTFRQKGRRPEIWNALTGTYAEAPIFERTHSGTTVPVEFAPWGSTFVIFRKPLPERWIVDASPVRQGLKAGQLYANTETVTVHYSDDSEAKQMLGPLPESQVVQGPWQVHFMDGRGAPEKSVFNNLISWSEHPHAGIRYYSGTAVYTSSFDVSLLNPDLAAILDLGQVADIARVFVNGEEVDILWAPPFQTNISPYLRQGSNSLQVHVANRWINRLIGDEAIAVDYTYQTSGGSKFTDGRIEVLPEWLRDPSQRFKSQRHSFSIWKHYDADSPLVLSGLLGPVTISWFWRINDVREQ